MPFESLAFRHTYDFTGFPDRWLPLIHLYDADLPLFPVTIFMQFPVIFSNARQKQREFSVM